MLDVRDVTVRFPTSDGQPAAVIDGVSLRVSRSEIVGLLGPSGSGKSTMLRVIAGLHHPDEGQVWIDGRDVTEVPTHRRGVGMVFQNEQLFPHRSVAQNIEFGLRMLKHTEMQRHRRTAALLALVGLDGFAGRSVTDLSGGERKRVALARSLAPDPTVLLLDEPLTGLDRALHDRLAVDLASILRAADTTVLLVTHDGDEAAAIADRVVEIDDLGAAARVSAGRREFDAASTQHSGSGAGAPGPIPEVVAVTAADTYELRRTVLRKDTPSNAVVYPGDDDDETRHLAVRAGERILAVSTWIAAPLPGEPGVAGLQLRGMAAAPGAVGRGYGTLLLDAGRRRAEELEVGVVWARARSTALTFYLERGFEALGEEFIDDTSGLPHRLVVRWVSTSRLPD